MAPLESYRTGMSEMVSDQPVRLVLSTQFLVKMGIAGFLIWAGYHYSHSECGHPLALFLWVNGIAWMSFLLIFLLSILASSGQSDGAAFTLAACFPCLLCGLCVGGPFLMAWFILGNVWVFQESEDTCNNTLYRIAFWYLIAMYVWSVVSCCCFGGSKYRSVQVVGGHPRQPLLGESHV